MHCMLVSRVCRVDRANSFTNFCNHALLNHSAIVLVARVQLWPITRAHNNGRHQTPLTFGAPTNGLGALLSSLLFSYSLTCNSLGALSCPFKWSWKWVPFKILISRPASHTGCVECRTLNPVIVTYCVKETAIHAQSFAVGMVQIQKTSLQV